MQREPKKIAIVGLGRQGLEHFHAALALEEAGDINIVALCDSKQNNLDKFKCSGYLLYDDYNHLFNNENIDAVIIATPNFTHFDIAQQALKKKIHVLKEKPLSLTIEEGTCLIRLAKENNCIFKTAQQREYHPAYQTAKNWLKNIGKIRYFDYFFSLNDLTKSWYWNKQQGGGCWPGLGWHGCWILAYFLGIPSRIKLSKISGKKRLHLSDTEDTCILDCSYQNGVVARLFLSVVFPDKKEELIIEGEFGLIKLTRDALTLYDVNGTPINTRSAKYAQNIVMGNQLKSFIDSISNDVYLSDKNAMNALYVFEAGSQSKGQFIQASPHVLSSVVEKAANM